MECYSDYDAFAWLYNKEWTFFGDNIFPGLKAIAGDKLPDGARILDLCCGTGQLARVLTEKGYKVTGIDGSEEMLRYARKNAPAAEFILDDARTFQFPDIHNAVFSTFDALNHVMTIEELLAVFKNVFECLVNGGIFIFDLTTEKHFETLQKGFKDVKEKPDYLFTIRCDYNTEKRLGESHFTVFQPRGNNWKRSDIVLYQTWYPCEDIKSSLRKAGFTGIRTHSFSPQRELEEATEDSVRIFFLAEKP
jgi:SAM-dependent methyltransferase